eukprot:scaffold46009_cov298-Isochrysis_galbana.AAC.5
MPVWCAVADKLVGPMTNEDPSDTRRPLCGMHVSHAIRFCSVRPVVIAQRRRFSPQFFDDCGQRLKGDR